MKLHFILHGFLPEFPLTGENRYPVCWIEEQPFITFTRLTTYEKLLIAFVESPYNEEDEAGMYPWANYKIKKL
jgi:hypothetical protein